jgi:hypothetical protein
MKTYKHWSAMRQTRGVPPQSGDVFGGMPHSGDVLVEMKVSQNTFWRKMNRHCTLGGKKPRAAIWRLFQACQKVFRNSFIG